MSERVNNINLINTLDGLHEADSPVEKNIDSMINCPALISGLSHEMRTHMNSIVAFTFLMNNSNLNDEERKEFSNQILDSCEQLMFMFDNFFDSVFIDTGNVISEAKNCSINNLVSELITEFGALLKKEGKNEIVLIHENQAIFNDEVFIDNIRVNKVLRNLFRNSVNNTSSGYIKIGHSQSDGIVTFYVLDSGTGYVKNSDLMSEQSLHDAILKYNDTATALNLAVSRLIIATLGGRMWIERNGISGTGFYFTLPVKKSRITQIPFKKLNDTRIAI